MKHKLPLICLALLTVLILPSLSVSAPVQTPTSWQDTFTDTLGISAPGTENITVSGGYAELDRYSGITWWDPNWKYMKVINISYQSSGTPSSPPPGSETGLVGYWHFAEGSGTAAKDGSGNGNDGMIRDGITNCANSNCPNWTTGRFGNGLEFDGNDDNVFIPYDPSLTPESISVEAWIYPPTGIGQGYIVSNGGLGNGNFLIQISATGRLQVYVYTNNSGSWRSQSTPEADISKDVWHHVAFTYDQDRIKVYIDGTLSLDFNAINEPLMKYQKDLYIGNRQDLLRDFKGIIDEVRIWNRALTPEEIQSNYEEDLDSNLIGSWHLSENTGTTAQDSSSNNNEGILIDDATPCSGGNCPTWTSGKIGTGVHFDGINDNINVPNNPSLDFSGDFTIAYWILFSDTREDAQPISKWKWIPGRNFGWHFRTFKNGPDTDMYFNADGSGNIWILNDYVPETWYHIAVTRSGSTIRGYLNGIDIGGTATSRNLNNNTALSIGRAYDTSRPFNGTMDEIRIYDRSLTPSEIMALYDSGSGDYLEGSWKFSEGSGTITADSSSKGNDGILINGASFDPAGRIGPAVVFDGIDDHIDLGNPDDLNPGTFDVTYSAWFKTTDSDGMIMNFQGGTGWDAAGSYQLRVSGGKLRMLLAREVSSVYYFIDVTSTNAVNDGQWHHGAFTFRYSDILGELFLDGTSQGTDSNTSWSAPDVQTGRNFSIGLKHYNTGDSNFFAGTIDEVRIYRKALSAAEIQAIYAGSNNEGNLTDYQLKIEKGLVGSWHLSEDSGISTKDTSGNGNNGTLKDFNPANSDGNTPPQWTTGKIGRGLKFDGMDDYIDIGNPPSLNIRGAITLEAWIKWNGSDNPYFVTKTGDSTHRSYDLSGNVDGTVEFRVGGATCNIISTTGGVFVSPDEWVHLAGVYEPSGYLRLYVDGSLAKENTALVPPSQCENGLDWYIGAREGNQGFTNGTIDEVRIYNKTLSPEEIRAHYDAGLANHYADEDYRYINTSGTSVLSHWSENDNIDWVKVPLIKSGEDTPIYLYYGNPSVANISDGDATFEFFDDFEVDLSKWTQISTSTTSEINRVTSEAQSGSYSAEVYQTLDNGDTALVKSFASEETGREVRMYFYDDGGSIAGYRHFLDVSNVLVHLYIGVYSTYPSTYTYRIRLDIGSPYIDTGILRTIGWHEFKWRINADKAEGFIDGAQIFSTIDMLNMSEIAIGSYWTSRPGFYNDLAIVRKHVTPEPEISIYLASGDITRGELTSVDIVPAGMTGWDRFYTSNTSTAGTSITYEIQNASNGAILCSLLSGNGDDISTCASSAQSVRLHSILSTTDPSTTPEVYLWNITWFSSSPIVNGTIEGTVSNTTGPLDNVMITASNGTHTYINYTGISGQYVLNIPPSASTYSVTATKAGYLPNSANILVESGITKTQNFILQQSIVTDIINDAIVYFTTGEKSTINMGTINRITVYIKNPKDTAVMVPLHIGSSYPEFRNLIEFENTGHRDIDIKLGPHEERYVQIEVFAGKTGSYDLIIGPDDAYANRYDEISIVIINRGASIFSNTPGLRLLSLALIVALAAILLYRSSGSRVKVRPHRRRNRAKSK